jgi:hypothetical protein
LENEASILGLRKEALSSLLSFAHKRVYNTF